MALEAWWIWRHMAGQGQGLESHMEAYGDMKLRGFFLNHNFV